MMLLLLLLLLVHVLQDQSGERKHAPVDPSELGIRKGCVQSLSAVKADNSNLLLQGMLRHPIWAHLHQHRQGFNSMKHRACSSML